MAKTKEWRDSTFPVPRECYFCKKWVWGKGRIGFEYWTYDIDVYRAHTACQALEVLGGGNN